MWRDTIDQIILCSEIMLTVTVSVLLLLQFVTLKKYGSV